MEVSPVTDKSWIIIILCAVAVLFGLSTYLPGEQNSANTDNIGYAINLYQNFSPTINSFSLPNSLDYAAADNARPITFSISDDAVYKTAYVSINGTSWQPITLTGTILSGNWLKQATTGTYDIPRIKIPNGTGTDNYLIIYSCTKNTTGNNITWDCHNNKWQIKTFNTTKTDPSNNNSGNYPTITIETPINGATITSNLQEITATTTSNTNTSTWIDFDNSLIGYWSMDYYSQSGIYDNSTYKRIGTFNGGLGTNNIVAGARGKGLMFDGINDNINVSGNFGITSQFTTSAWVNTNANNNGRIISKHGGGSYGWLVSRLLDTQSVEFRLSTTGSDWIGGETSSNSFLTHTWYNIATTYDGNTMRVYINGVENTGGEFPISVKGNINVAPAPLQIGDDGKSDINYFNGTMDEVMLFNRALSSSEIKTLYDSKANKFDATLADLSNGQHSYTLYAIDGSGNFANSGLRTLNVNSAACTPACSGKQCGSDGCSGTCGTCLSTQSCTGNICVNNIVSPDCTDGILNQGESGIDCGGPCAACSTPVLKTYYVSTSGSDSTGNGSSSAPWKTLSYACSHVTTSGYIIHVNAGTYSEDKQCILAPGVSIEGVGANSIIKSTLNNAPTIYLYSSSVTNGNQHISNIKMDGNDLTAYEPIVIDKRSNVEIHDCTFVNFYFSGVSFYGENRGDDVQPNNFCLNNKFYNNVITNCASFNIEGSPGNLQIDGQQGMRVYNNVITQTARGARADGFGIKCVQGLNKDMKVYNNTITIDNDDESQFDFAMEFWDSLGGIEVYNNRVQGPIDLAGHFGRKGNYSYTYSVHDNIIGPDSLKTTSRHGMYIENTHDLSDIYIYNNKFQNLNNPIKIETWSTASFSNIQIYYNLFYNVGVAGEGWNTNGFCEGNFAGYTLDNLKFYNNVFIAATAAGANPISAIQIPGRGTTTNVEIKNNIFMNFNYAIYTGNSGGTITGVTIANNILYNIEHESTVYWAGTVPTAVSESNTITANPLFNSPTDFRLQKSSPAIDKGIIISGMTKDYSGNPVPYPSGGATDIGAYEYHP